jgi:anaerobic selenocysteine-containing dehydrogenase
MRIEETKMKRRDFLKVSGGLSAHLIVGGSLLSIRKAEAQTGLPIAALQALLDPKKDMVLVPTNKDFSKYNRSFNKRTQIAPRVRVVAGSAKAVSTTMLWAANNGLRFMMHARASAACL